jgi:hypothetical protein
MARHSFIHRLFVLDSAPFEALFRAALSDRDDLGPVLSMPSPWGFADGPFSLNSLIKSVLDKSYHPSPSSVRLLLTAPDSLVTFGSVDFGLLSEFDRLRATVESLPAADRPSRLLKAMRVLAPIVARVPDSSVIGTAYTSFADFCRQVLSRHPIVAAFEVRQAAYLARSHICDVGLVVRVIVHCVRRMEEIYASDFAHLLIPFLAPPIARLLVPVLHLMFPVHSKSARAAFRLYCTQASIEILTKIAAMYPPALAGLPLQLIQSYFWRFPSGQSETLPSFEFIAQFPHISDQAQTAGSINALCNSFALLATIVQPGVGSTSRDAVLGALVKLSRVHAFARAAARSLENLAKFDLYRPAFEWFRRLLVDGDRRAVVLYLEMAAYNFTPAFNRFEKTYTLARVARAANLIHEAEFKALAQISTPDVSSARTLFDVVRLVDGAMILDDPHLAILIGDHGLLRFIGGYLAECARATLPILDARTALPFAHLGASWAELMARISPPGSRSVVGLNIEFVLVIFKTIVLCAPTRADCQEEPSGIAADIFIERKRFARAIAGYTPRLLAVAALKVENLYFSLLDALIFMAADLLNARAVVYDDLVSFVDFMMQHIEPLVLSASEMLFDAHVAIWSQLFQYVASNHLKKFLPIVTNILKKTIDEGPIAVRLLMLLARLTVIPEVKLALLFDSGLEDFFDVILTALKPESAQRNEPVALLACEFLTNMTSVSITCNQRFDHAFRSATEALPKRMMERLMLVITQLLVLKRAQSIKRVWIAALRLLRFACASPHYLAELRDVPQFALPLQDVYAHGLFVDKDEDVPCLLLEIGTELARVDRAAALALLGFDRPDRFLEEIEEVYNRTLGAFVDALEHQMPQSGAAPVKLRAIQKVYAKKVERYNDGKVNVASPALPPGMRTLQTVPEDIMPFFEAVTLGMEALPRD